MGENYLFTGNCYSVFHVLGVWYIEQSYMTYHRANRHPPSYSYANTARNTIWR